MEQHKIFGTIIRRLFLTKDQVEKGYLQVLKAGVGEAEDSAEWQWQGRLRRLKDHVDEVCIWYVCQVMWYQYYQALVLL